MSTNSVSFVVEEDDSGKCNESLRRCCHKGVLPDGGLGDILCFIAFIIFHFNPDDFLLSLPPVTGAVS